MCRNIRILFNFAPPVTEDEIRAASLQFVRKVSGFAKPSKGNEAAFAPAVDDIAAVTARASRRARDPCACRGIAKRRPPRRAPGRPCGLRSDRSAGRTPPCEPAYCTYLITKNVTPCGEVMPQKRPTLGTSCAGTQIVAPSACASRAVASASLTVK